MWNVVALSLLDRAQSCITSEEQADSLFQVLDFSSDEMVFVDFPPAETFLSNGALMTGEASPGYLVRFNLHISLCQLMHMPPTSFQTNPIYLPSLALS